MTANKQKASLEISDEEILRESQLVYFALLNGYVRQFLLDNILNIWFNLVKKLERKLQ